MERNLCDDPFWNKRNPGDLEWTSRKQRGSHEAGRCAQGGRCAPTLVAPPTYFFHLYILIYLKTYESTTKPHFHRRNLLYP